MPLLRASSSSSLASGRWAVLREGVRAAGQKRRAARGRNAVPVGRAASRGTKDARREAGGQRITGIWARHWAGKRAASCRFD